MTEVAPPSGAGTAEQSHSGHALRPPQLAALRRHCRNIGLGLLAGVMMACATTAPVDLQPIILDPVAPDPVAPDPVALLPDPAAVEHDAEAVGETVSEDPPEDLWERLRRGFELPETGHARLQPHLDFYARHPDYLRRVSIRAERYLYHIVNELERRGLPLELALLPIVESAFDPFAYSHGRAAGLWQFIPATGRTYGLQQDWWHDQRRDVVESTRAALDFLEHLSGQFDGDWLLALAAYNAGPGNVRRALRRNDASGEPLDFFALPLPAETRAYVPKLLALRKLVADPTVHGIELPELANEPYFRVVRTGGQIDLAQAAALADVDSEEIYLLNPALNRWATHPEGPHRLLVPVAAAADLEAGIVALADADRVAWKRHTIRPGESLSTIAGRYGTDVTTLRQVNDLSSSVIRAGAALLIPTASAATDDYALSQQQRDARRDQRNENAAGNRRELRYRVRPGDSFWSIARAHGVSMREVAGWNGMATRDPLRAGRELLLWLPEGAGSAAAPAQRDEVVRRVGYRVRTGDSLYRIASRFGVSVHDIAEWNQLNPARYLQPGQQLTLYVSVAGTL